MIRLASLIIFLLIALNGISQSYIPDPSYVAGYYPLDTSFTSFGYAWEQIGNNDGIPSGNLISTTDRFGSNNSTYYFDGNGSYFDCGDVNVFEGSSYMSFSFWIKPNSLGSDFSELTLMPIISKWQNSSNLSNCSYRFVLDGTSLIASFCDGTNIEEVSCPINFNVNEWTHIICNFESGIVRLYINGTEQISQLLSAITSIQNSGSSFKIGDWNHSIDQGYSTFEGSIDEIIIYSDFALSSCSVAEIFFAQAIDGTVSQQGNILSSNENNSISYAWYDCDLNNYLPGENNQTYIPISTGNYSVLLEVLGCATMSDCYYFEFVDIEELTQDKPEIIRILDLFGREAEYKPNTVLIYEYSDGSIRRVFNFE